MVTRLDLYYKRYKLLKQYLMSEYAPYINVDEFRLAELPDIDNVTLPDIKNESMFVMYKGQLYSFFDNIQHMQYCYIIDTYKYSRDDNFLFYHISTTDTGTYLLCYVIDMKAAIFIHTFTLDEYQQIANICKRITKNFEIKRTGSMMINYSKLPVISEVLKPQTYPDVPFVDIRG